MNDSQQVILNNLYRQYIEIIKPLIALWEAREEKFMTPILNEIRAFNDHIARCYINNSSQQFIDSQLKMAGRHVNRLILDCYKYLNLSFNSEIEKFEKRTKNVDLSIINNGSFFVTYHKLRKETIVLLKKAKNFESQEIGDEEKYKLFELSFNSYVELIELIDTNLALINWAKTKSWLKKYSWIIAAIISGIISVIVADIFGCKLIDYLLKP